MKKIFIIAIISFFNLSINAQIIEPVEWIYNVKKISENEYELYMLAFIDKPWHLYGQYFEDGGPVKMEFKFVKNDNYTLIDSVFEKPKPKVEHDEIFDIDVQYFTKKALFIQKLKINKPTEIIIMLTGQACNSKTGMCVLVADEHVFMLN